MLKRSLKNMQDSRHDPLVAPLAEREDDAVEGAFYVVRGQCITCSLPCELAPRNIRWNAGYKERDHQSNPIHCRVAEQPRTENELEQMIEAAVGSCISSIRYCGSDKQTLNRFREEGVPELCDALPEASLDGGASVASSQSIWKRFCVLFGR